MRRCRMAVMALACLALSGLLLYRAWQDCRDGYAGPGGEWAAACYLLGLDPPGGVLGMNVGDTSRAGRWRW